MFYALANQTAAFRLLLAAPDSSAGSLESLQGWTAFHETATLGNHAMFKQLLAKFGANRMEEEPKSRGTVLMVAASRGCQNVRSACTPDLGGKLKIAGELLELASVVDVNERDFLTEVNDYSSELTRLKGYLDYGRK